MAAPWKTIRVFISSTFKDMHAERDHLVRFVFPKLREELLKWRVHLEDVDLRWGVTTDQDAFDLCMTEIKNCHPRFLCMLGGRYGWVPPPREISSDFLVSVLNGASGAGELAPVEEEALSALYAPTEDATKHRLKAKPRTQDELEVYQAQSEIAVRVLQRAGLDAARRSITASEIHYGALDRLQIPAFRYFYFRKDSVTDSIPEPFAKDYREAPGSPAERCLAEIKRRIKDPATLGRVLTAPGHEEDRPLTCHEYSCEWDAATSRIVDLKEFGDLVYGDLLASVRAQFGDVPEQKEAQTDEEKFAEEAEQMEAFIEERTQRYILGSRGPLMRDLLAFTTADGTPNLFVLTGDPGSGKSAFLAKFTRELFILHPSAFILSHFIGASTGSTDLRRTLRRLCHELAPAAGNTEPLPLDIKELITHFQKLLIQAAAKQRVILVLDALNQLDTTDGAHWMNWLPRELPPGVRIIASVIAPAEGEKEHQTLAILRNRKDARVEELKPLNETDTLGIIEGYLKRYSKRLSEEQITALKQKPASHLPLYVLTALEELRTLGTYEEITGRIRELPGDARALFGWILTERLARDPGFRDREGRRCGASLVEKFAACLGVSRHGLSPAELTALLDPGDPLGNVAALLRLLRPYLMRRGELLDFYHGQFREAAEAAHLDIPEKQRAAHQTVATCLQAFADPRRDGQCRDATPHALSELPHHQTRAVAWPELIATLENIFFLETKVTHGMAFDLVEDFTAAVDSLPPDHAERQRLRLLLQALRRDIHFIARHANDYPQGLFQCLWNSAWWYDCPEAAHHFLVPEGGGVEPPPWKNPDTEGKLSTLLDHWRADREATHPTFPWLRTLRPPSPHLGADSLAVLHGHENQILSVAFSPDGHRVLSGSSDETLRLWDAQSGRELAVLSGHRSFVTSVAFSSDGRWVLSGSEDKTVRLWDAQSGRELAVLMGHEDAVRSVAFSPDGRWVLSGSEDKTVRLWDTVNRHEQTVLRGHAGRVTSVAFSPDGRRVLSGSEDKTVRLWDAPSGRELAVLMGHENAVRSVAFSPDGRWVLSGSEDKTVRLWDTVNRHEQTVLRGHAGRVTSVAFSPDGRRVLSGSRDRTVRLWDAQHGREITMLRGHGAGDIHVAFSPDGCQVLSGSWDGTIRLWDAQRGPDLAVLRGHADMVTSVAFSPDGCRVVSGSRTDSTMRLWDAQNGREIAVLRADDWVKSVAFSTDGRWVVSRDWFDDNSQVWNAESGHRLGDAADVPSPWVEVPISRGWRANFGDRHYEYDFTPEGIRKLWISRVCECPRRQDETNFTPATGGPPLAWFPDALKIITVHSDGLHWAGSGRFTNHLVLLRLEGG